MCQGMPWCSPVSEVVPVEWARMENRTVVQWDKDDCSVAGLVKFDLLGLGMLTALHKMIDLVAEHHDLSIELRGLQPTDPAVYEMPTQLPGTSVGIIAPPLPGMTDGELTVADVWATGVSPDSHPIEHLREGLRAGGAISIDELKEVEEGTRVRVGGLVTHRQRPATAGGVTFLNLEDETGMLNVVCSPGLWARYHTVAMGGSGLLVRGRLERVEDTPSVLNLLADRLDRLPLTVAVRSRDFR
jgi:DNA polymerase III alpha subunit